MSLEETRAQETRPVGEVADGDLPALDVLPEKAGHLDAFLSYSRHRDSQNFVDRLWVDLRDLGKEVWLDRSSIEPGADWRQRIDRGIEAASAVIFVITPESACSAECRLEVDTAVGAAKRLVPVVLRRVPPEDLPEALNRPNWVDFEDPARYEQSFAELVQALETDIEWRDAHARLATRAREWDEARHDRSYLLRGSDLRAAEDWFGDKGNHAEQPTDVQYRYIVASRRSAARRQRTLTSAIAIGLVVSLGAAAFAFVQRQDALTQSHRAESVQMAAESTNLLGDNTPAAALLAIEADQRYPTGEARAALAQAAAARIERILGPDLGRGLQATFSDDGARLVSAGWDGRIEVWDTSNWRMVASRSYPYSFDTVAASTAGGLVAAGQITNGASHVVLWNPSTGVSRVLPAHSVVSRVAFSPDGRTLAVGTYQGTVTMWDVTRDVRLRNFSPDSSNVQGLVFSPDGRLLATGTFDGHVDLYDAAGGAPLSSWSTGVPSDDLAFNGTSSELADAGGDGHIFVWQTATGAETTLQNGVDVDGVAFTPDGSSIVAGDYGGGLAVFNAVTGDVLTRFHLGSPVWSVDVSPDGSKLSATDDQGQIAVFDTASLNPGGGTSTLSVSPNGRLVATSGPGNDISIWDEATGGLVGRWTVPSLGGLTFGPDGKLAVLSGDELSKWTVTGRRLSSELVSGGIISGGSNADGSLGVFGSGAGTMILEAVPHGPRWVWLPPSRADEGGTWGVGFSPNGRQIVAAGYGGSGGAGGWLASWSTQAVEHAPTGRTATVPVQWSATDPSTIQALAVQPHGDLVATGDRNGLVALFDLSDGHRVATWVDGNDVEKVAFSPDGTWLAVGDSVGDVTLWNVATGDRITVDVGESVTAVAFTPDGRTLAVDDGPVVLYPVSTWTASLSTVKAMLCKALNGTELSTHQWATYVPDAGYQRTCPVPSSRS